MKKKMSSDAAKKGDMKKMSPKDRFKAMMEAKKKKAGTKEKMSYGSKKKKGQKMSITAKKAKVVTHKKKGRV